MRCYNGCPDKELQAFIGAKQKAHDRLKKAGLRATFFPAEGQYMVFDSQHRAVTGFFDTVQEAASAALST